MSVLQKYFVSEIGRSVLFVLTAFLALFAFFDMMGELKYVGKRGYEIQHAFLFVMMGLPGYIYELMPIAALIGTIWTLAQFASRSEFTIMRAAGMSTGKAGRMLAKIGVVLAIVTFAFGEFVAPVTARLASQLKLARVGGAVSEEFRSGLWTKDLVRDNGLNGAVIGSRFLNVREVAKDGQLLDVKMYELNPDFQMTAMISAATAEYIGANTWRLSDVAETTFSNTVISDRTSAAEIAAAIGTRRMATKDVVSEITPAILSVRMADPDRMSAYDLAGYTRYLAENNQQSVRYEIAFWKKLVYPFAVFVMMALALPFAYLHFRSGGVSLKIFTGIMIGVSFQLINSLFSHLGLLNTWPPFATAVLPSALFLVAAITALRWVERH